MTPLRISVDSQCTATHHGERPGMGLFCLKRVGHRGRHKDHFGWWWWGPFHSRYPTYTFIQKYEGQAVRPICPHPDTGKVAFIYCPHVKQWMCKPCHVKEVAHDYQDLRPQHTQG